MESLEDLLEQQKKIGEKISALLTNSYSKYGMSEEVKNDNPYSRLMALKKMGIVENYEVTLLLPRLLKRRQCLLLEWEESGRLPVRCSRAVESAS